MSEVNEYDETRTICFISVFEWRIIGNHRGCVFFVVTTIPFIWLSFKWIFAKSPVFISGEVKKKAVTFYYHFVCHSTRVVLGWKSIREMNRKNAFCRKENEKCIFKWAPFVSFFSKVRLFVVVSTLRFSVSHANATLCHFRMRKLHNFCRAQYFFSPATSITTQKRDRKRLVTGPWMTSVERNRIVTSRTLVICYCCWPLHWMKRRFFLRM